MYRLLKDNYYFKESEILRDGDPVLVALKIERENTVTRLVLENPLDITLLSPERCIDKIKIKINQLNNKY